MKYVKILDVKLNNKENPFKGYENANLMTSVTGFKSAHLMGTVSKDGQENCTLLSSVVHMGSNPPCIGIVFRPHSVPRHGLENIHETKVFTLNAISKSMIKQAHQTSAKYPRDISEFEAVSLNTEYKEGCRAPYVVDAPIQMGCRFVEQHDVQVNGTHFVVGQIEALYVPEDVFMADGFVDLTALNVFTISGLDGYGKVIDLKRFGYARELEK